MSDYRGKTNYFGDRPMPIAGRTTHERERLLGMTMDERAWREKWCKDQELAPEEPKYLPELDAKLTNPIQKLYKTSLNWLFYTKLQPIIGEIPSYFLRHFIPKSIMAYLVICGFWYTFKYRESTWEKQSGWIQRWEKPTLYPGDPGYPHRPNLPPQAFFSKGFNERKTFLNMTMDGTSSR